MTILKNLKKHEILKIFYKGLLQFEKEKNKNKYQFQFDCERIAELAKIKIEESKNLCFELYKENFLKICTKDEDNRNHTYSINEYGINALLSNLLINRFLNLLFKIFAVTIPMIISFISLFKNYNNENAYEILNKRIDSLVYELKIKK